MKKNIITQEEMNKAQEAAYCLGSIMGRLLMGFIEGMDSECENIEEIETPQDWKRERQRNETKVYAEGEVVAASGDDCTFCWCDTCKLLNECKKHNNKIDYEKGIKPYPCRGCGDGEAFIVREWKTNESPPDCYKPD